MTDSSLLTDTVRARYNKQFAECIVTASTIILGAIVTSIQVHKSRYQSVGDPLGIPWWWIGAIHNMESSLNFTTHLHNGDPLSARTVNVPAGRPKLGRPPFTWEFSATDALQRRGVDQWHDWSVSGSLFMFELYNGLGYWRRGVPSPYLWAGSNQYVKGKYIADHVYSPEAISHQIGAAVITKQGNWIV